MDNSYENEKYIRVDKLAEELRLKSDKLSPTRKENLMTKLYYAVWNLSDGPNLEYMMGEFNYGFSASEKVRLDAVSDAYRTTLNVYGIIDNKTGEIVPFSKLFLHYYKLKRITFKSKEQEEENKWRKNAVALLINKLKKKYSYHGHKDLPNYLQRDAVEKFCSVLGAKEDEYVPFLESIFENKHLSDYALQDNKENVGNVDADASSIEGLYEDANENSDSVDDIEFSDTMQQVFKVLDKINQDVSISQSKKDYVRYLVTFTMVEENVPFKYGYEEYMEYELLQFANKSMEEKRQNILAEYLHIQSETARKNLKIAEKLLLKYYGKSD